MLLLLLHPPLSLSSLMHLDVRFLHLLQGAHFVVHYVLVQALCRVLVLLRPVLVHVKVVVVQVVLLRTAVRLQVVHRVQVAVVVDVQRYRGRPLREPLVRVHQQIHVLAARTRVLSGPGKSRERKSGGQKCNQVAKPMQHLPVQVVPLLGVQE